LAGSIPGIEQNLVVKDHEIGVDPGKKPARVARKSAADRSNFTRTSSIQSVIERRVNGKKLACLFQNPDPECGVD
jgi:hypothetical protein